VHNRRFGKVIVRVGLDSGSPVLTPYVNSFSPNNRRVSMTMDVVSDGKLRTGMGSIPSGVSSLVALGFRSLLCYRRLVQFMIWDG
jgi:hypothetical protein